MSNSDYFLNKLLGKDFESLLKTDIYKPGTRTVVDINDIKIGLQIVPRTVMSLLIRELSPMTINESKEIDIPFRINTVLKAVKHERDSISGEIVQENKKIAEFMHRSIPGVGLVLMSTLELYNIEDLSKDVVKENGPSDELVNKVQHLIDERLALHDLVGRVVDNKIQERDAIKQLLMAKINEALPEKTQVIHEEPIIEHPLLMDLPMAKSAIKKESPLKGFLNQKKNKTKTKPIEFSIEMAKGENVSCPDCQKNIFDGNAFSGCICFGEDSNKKVYIKKTEEGIKIRFGRGWDHENIEMLLSVLRSKRG